MRSQLIETRRLVHAGWIQHDLEQNGCYCLEGAIAESCGYDVRKRLGAMPVFNFLRQDPTATACRDLLTEILIDKDYRPAFGSVNILWQYNDDWFRTKDHVLAVLDAAIAKCPEPKKDTPA